MVPEGDVQSLGTYDGAQEVKIAARFFSCSIIATLCLAGCNSTPKSQIEIDNEARSQQMSQGAALAREAQINQRNGNFALATKQYREAVTLNPEMPAAWNNLGILLMDQKDFMNSATAFRRAADLLPTDPRPYENLGLCYRSASHMVESLEFYGKSLERDENWLPSLRGAILSAMEMQKVDDVLLERINRALLLETDPAWRVELERYKLRVQGELKPK